MYDFSYIKVDILTKTQKPYEFMGSAIRGALGYSLKEVTCINPSFTCRDCFALSNCLYYDFYEKRNSYHKYRVDTSMNGKLFEFGLYLYGDAKEKLPYLLSAIHKLLSQNGIGRVRSKEYYFYINDELVFDGKEFKIPPNPVKKFQIDTFCPDITLQLQSPLRMKRENSLLGAKDFDLIFLLNSIYQRYLKLTNQEHSKLPFEPHYEIEKSTLEWKKLKRYSNRQKTQMNMDGLIGEIVIKNIDKQSFELLKLGEITGGGKQTVMGLGKFKIKDLHERHR